MAKNYKGEEIPAEYGSDELLWRLCEFGAVGSPENSEYFGDKRDAERLCERAGVPLQPLTEEIVEAACATFGRD